MLNSKQIGGWFTVRVLSPRTAYLEIPNGIFNQLSIAAGENSFVTLRRLFARTHQGRAPIDVRLNAPINATFCQVDLPEFATNDSVDAFVRAIQADIQSQRPKAPATPQSSQ